MTLSLLDNILRPNKPKATITGGDLKSTSISKPRNGRVSFPSLPSISVPCPNCLSNSIPMANQRTLRGLTVVSFLPAFALCIAAGAVTQQALPAVGIIPQFFSSILGITLLAGPKQQRLKPSRARSSRTADDDAEAHIIGADADDDEPQQQPITSSFHVFLADVILATGLFAVLVPTWINGIRRGATYWVGDVMLTTYATVPLILNAVIHVVLAIQGFVAGTGLGRVGRAVGRAFARLFCLPEECPRCGNHLLAGDGDEGEAQSWFQGMVGGGGGRIKLPVSAVPGASTAVGWNAPPWLGRKGLAQVVEEEEEGAGARESYRDEGAEEGAGAGGKGKTVAVDGEQV